MGLTDSKYLPGVLTTNVQKILNWSRKSSIFYMLFGIACCAFESPMGSGMPVYDIDRFGWVFRASPRQSDLMIVAGTVTEKMAPRIRALYDQMAEPRYVIAFGACASDGGPFWKGYNVVQGVDKIIPVDVYVPGCPPRPEAAIDAFMKIQAKMLQEGLPKGKAV